MFWKQLKNRYEIVNKYFKLKRDLQKHNTII